NVGDDFRQRTIIANRTGQNEINLMLDALKHNALSQDAAGHSGRNATGGANGVDGAHMIFVPFIRQRAAREINPERSSIQSLFDVVHSEGITGEQEIDIAPLD